MPVQWTVSHFARLVIAVAKEELHRADIENYLDDIARAHALGYRKIFDMTHATPVLSDDDMMLLGARIRAYIALDRLGPLAIVATTDKSHRQARMFATLAEADRPLKIFRELHHRGNGWIPCPSRSHNFF